MCGGDGEELKKTQLGSYSLPTERHGQAKGPLAHDVINGANNIHRVLFGGNVV